MIYLTEENAESMKYHLTGFIERVKWCQKDNPDKSIMQIANEYINEQMQMQKDLQKYYDHENQIAAENKQLLLSIKKTKGRTFYKHLMQIIEESDRIEGLMEIVDEPVGEFQKENYGRLIKGIWVKQWSTGDSGDSFAGHVCVQMSENSWLKFSYSM